MFVWLLPRFLPFQVMNPAQSVHPSLSSLSQSHSPRPARSSSIWRPPVPLPAKMNRLQSDCCAVRPFRRWRRRRRRSPSRARTVCRTRVLHPTVPLNRARHRFAVRIRLRTMTAALSSSETTFGRFICTKTRLNPRARPKTVGLLEFQKVSAPLPVSLPLWAPSFASAWLNDL